MVICFQKQPEIQHERKCPMSALTLKIIALISMFIDHAYDIGLIGQQLIMDTFSLDVISSSPINEVISLLGRIAFPIFAFMVAEGARHTRNIKKYILRLFIFALISEIPFDALHWPVAFSKLPRFIGFFRNTNVLYTFALAVSGIALCNLCRSRGKGRALQIASLAVPALLSVVLSTDYTIFGVALVYAAYLPGENRRVKFAAMAGVLAVLYLGYASYWFTSLTMNNVYEFGMACVSLLLLWFYNGRRGGWSGALSKWLFYIAYPAHLALLALWRILTNPLIIH